MGLISMRAAPKAPPRTAIVTDLPLKRPVTNIAGTNTIKINCDSLVVATIPNKSPTNPIIRHRLNPTKGALMSGGFANTIEPSGNLRNILAIADFLS